MELFVLRFEEFEISIFTFVLSVIHVFIRFFCDKKLRMSNKN